jgi:hypothetical protein
MHFAPRAEVYDIVGLTLSAAVGRRLTTPLDWRPQLPGTQTYAGRRLPGWRAFFKGAPGGRGPSTAGPSSLRPSPKRADAAARLPRLKLDRLSRDVHFHIWPNDAPGSRSWLPSLDLTSIRLYSTCTLRLAEKERALISQRTRAALKAAKSRGTRLGNPNLARIRGVGAAALRAQSIVAHEVTTR